MQSYIRLVLGSTMRRRNRENSSGRGELRGEKEATERRTFLSTDTGSMYRLYRSNSNYSKTSPRASKRSILIPTVELLVFDEDIDSSIRKRGDLCDLSIVFEIDFVSSKTEQTEYSRFGQF